MSLFVVSVFDYLQFLKPNAQSPIYKKVNARHLAFFLFLFFQYTLLGANKNEDSTTTNQDKLLDIAIQMEDWTYKSIDSSRYYACLLMNECLIQRDSYYLANAYTGLAYTYFYQHRLKEALEYLVISNKLFLEVGDSIDISDVHMNFGNVYTEMGYYERGIDYYKSAEKYLPENSEWLDYNLAYLYFNTSETFMDLGDLQNSSEYLAKAEASAIKDSVDDLLFAIKNKNAELLLLEGKDEEARKYAQLALKQAQEYGDLIEQSKALELLAKIQAKNGNNEKAISLQQEALNKATQFGDPVIIAKQYGHMASILLTSGKTKEALHQARIAYKYAQLVKSPLLYKTILITLAQALEENNFPQEALSAYKRYYAYKDTIADVNINERLLLTKTKIQSQDSELLKAKNSIQQQTIRQNRIVMIGIGAAFFLTLVLMLVMFNNLRRKRKSQLLIEEKQKLLNAKSEELNQSNKQLKQLNEGKDKLFSILTHDLKQPFNQTLQLLEVLNSQMKDDDELRSVANQVKESVEATSGTLDNLLTWSKSQFLQLNTEQKIITLNSVTDDLKAEFKESIRQKELNCVINVDSKLTVLADPNHLEIMLRNLLQNAIKFSRPGGLVKLTAAKKAQNIYIEVSDQGQGMNKEQLDNLFDVNTHFSTPGTLNEKGTGLGMLIVNDFVKENNGKLEVESKPNEGSTFRIILPAA